MPALHSTEGVERIRPSFDSLECDDGLGITDPIERRYFELLADGPVEPTAVEASQFSVPIDRAVSVECGELVVPQMCKGFVRDEDRAVVAEIEHFERHDLPAGRYSIELTAPVKLHLHVSGPMTVETGLSEISFAFERETAVLVGARSYHERPAATITTTGDPTDLMRAVSRFGSALKTTDCERSYPTLRGHPPGLELGDELDVPPGLERPETGIGIEVPADLGSVFVVAPLAYYLGAEVVPGTEPRLVTDTGFEQSLDGPEGFEVTAGRVLRQTFLLDCITRTEGAYPIDLQERTVVDPVVDLDFGALHGQPPADQLEAYLSVPFAVVRDHLPTWKLASHVTPVAENAEALPFLVDDLAIVRSPRARTISRQEAQSAAVEEFMDDARTRSGTTTRGEESTSTLPTLVDPEDIDSLEQAWVGENAPLGASKASVEAFRNRLDRERSEGDIDITVVCNDPEMLEEHETAGGVYGSRDELPIDVTLYTQLDTQRLRFVLESETDYLHYVGHIDDEGIECPDGKLDVSDLESVGVDVFFLNACRSYDQGLKLIECGAVGGVVTLDDVLDSGALRVGETLARLLNRGFPLRAALEIARDRSIVGGQYLVVGDGNVDIAHAESITPYGCDIETYEDGYDLSLELYPVRGNGMGTIFQPNIGEDPPWYLNSGTIGPFEMDRAELEAFLALEICPVRIDGAFAWSDTVDLGEH